MSCAFGIFRPLLEFNSVIWPPRTRIAQDRLVTALRRFNAGLLKAVQNNATMHFKQKKTRTGALVRSTLITAFQHNHQESVQLMPTNATLYAYVRGRA